MFAAIPFFQLEVYNLHVPGVGVLPIDPWATLVCIGFVVGLEVARWRGIRLRLDTRDVVDGAVFTVVVGFVVAHIVTVLFYFPERLTESGIWAILRVWEGFSSTGGFLGAVLGAWLFYTRIRPRGALRHADVICFGFPFGWFFGRMGCGVVHDHIGSVTSFPLAMNFDAGFGPWVEGAQYATGIRHELGLYEMMYMVPVAALFLYWGRSDRVPGFFLGWFGALYAPFRFLLDFLRNNDLSHQDARYLGLTPAQYGMVLLFGVSVWFLLRLDQQGWSAHPDRVDLEGTKQDLEPGVVES
ncbi:MAG: prolipoprotein diacylglyceryl transferase [Myxococcales bacterium]|nr:prolipoprotein diacylglyceryl transferase [Myxococcales bacterium]